MLLSAASMLPPPGIGLQLAVLRPPLPVRQGRRLQGHHVTVCVLVVCDECGVGSTACSSPAGSLWISEP
jgi:hypothetical protein